VNTSEQIIDLTQPVLLTGSTGFIGDKLVCALLRMGFKNIRCLVRPSSDPTQLERVKQQTDSSIEIVKGNLLSREDCEAATDGISVIYHLAAGTGTKSFADAF
jgi:thioester reductase-like protein